MQDDGAAHWEQGINECGRHSSAPGAQHIQAAIVATIHGSTEDGPAERPPRQGPDLQLRFLRLKASEAAVKMATSRAPAASAFSKPCRAASGHVVGRRTQGDGANIYLQALGEAFAQPGRSWAGRDAHAASQVQAAAQAWCRKTYVCATGQAAPTRSTSCWV